RRPAGGGRPRLPRPRRLQDALPLPLRHAAAQGLSAAALREKGEMKPAQIREMSDEHLRLTLTETIKHLFQLRFQSATERLETPSEIRKARRDVARLMTIQRERELTATKNAENKGT